MTDIIEKQFFDTFGIEPDIKSCYHLCEKDLNCKECNEAEVIYPQITDRILLELICIYSRISNLAVCVDKVKELKEDILEQFIENSEDFKHQVRTLFEDGK